MTTENLLYVAGGFLAGALSAYLVGKILKPKPTKVEHETPNNNEEAVPAEEISDEDWREVERVDYSNMVDKLYASDDAKGVTHYTPYQISYEDYVDPTYEDYDREALTYYSDGILANIRDEIIKDHEEVVGDALEALMEEGVDTVYVRDDSNYIQYEIDRDVDAYVDVVGPIPDDDD